MPIQGFIATLFATTLLTVPGAKTTAPNKAQAGSEFTVEIVDKNVKKTSRFGFLVSINGSIEAWVAQGTRNRFCRLKAEERRNKTHIELRCEGDKALQLRVETTRMFRMGMRTKVAEVQRQGGATSQVYVTLR